ncbi:hypothetical protein RJ639_027288 [Escallonia herrerae]|uniref:Transcription factor MYB1R1 n=1 Tax=Escallonia herrerae TaxID=1293975 RepID=A0AA89BE31_9ASTE|nr:hypothetical protein RJ639_027288 [Escallonia herrerae]
MFSTSSRFGNDANNSGPEAGSGAVAGGKGIMLFGVRVMEGSFRKSASMNNLAQYEQPHDSTADAADGYASDDVIHNSTRSRERKRGVPWTEEEHKLFLLGLQKVGKGDWRGISRNFVKTRTPTQVASHAQKYFLRRNNHNRRRRRSSLFDITTDTFMDLEDHYKAHHETLPQSHLRKDVKKFPASAFPVTRIVSPAAGENPIESLTLGPAKQVKKLIRPIPIFPVPPSSKLAQLNLNNSSTVDSLPLSLKLLPSQSSSDQKSPPARQSPSFQAMSGSFNSSSGDSIISVA